MPMKANRFVSARTWAVLCLALVLSPLVFAPDFESPLAPSTVRSGDILGVSSRREVTGFLVSFKKK